MPLNSENFIHTVYLILKSSVWFLVAQLRAEKPRRRAGVHEVKNAAAAGGHHLAQRRHQVERHQPAAVRVPASDEPHHFRGFSGSETVDDDAVTNNDVEVKAAEVNR